MRSLRERERHRRRRASGPLDAGAWSEARQLLPIARDVLRLRLAGKQVAEELFLQLLLLVRGQGRAADRLAVDRHHRVLRERVDRVRRRPSDAAHAPCGRLHWARQRSERAAAARHRCVGKFRRPVASATELSKCGRSPGESTSGSGGTERGKTREKRKNSERSAGVKPIQDRRAINGRIFIVSRSLLQGDAQHAVSGGLEGEEEALSGENSPQSRGAIRSAQSISCRWVGC